MRILSCLLLSIFLIACEKDGPALPSPVVVPVVKDTTAEQAKILFSFKATVNSQTLLPISKYNQNASKELFTVT